MDSQVQRYVTHADIDRRLLRLVTLCIGKLERDPALLRRVRDNAGRLPDLRLRREWESLLALPWFELRARLLDPGESGAELRQNAPLGGLLTNAERMRVFKEI